jgi:acyl-CoA thioester hydrolase
MTGCAILLSRIDKWLERMNEVYEQPIAVRTYDIDFAGIVSNIVFVRWLEDLRLGLLEAAYPLAQALAEDVAPVLLSTRIEYRRPIVIGDAVMGRMRVLELARVRWRVAAEFAVGAAVHAEAEQHGFFMRLSTRRPIPIPPRIRARYPA